MDGDYCTINGSAEAAFTEKRSEFTGRLRHTETEEEAIDFIEEVRAANRKATHNVYAYILRQDNITRYSDDGEPQGTAGVPVLETLRKEGLTDVCCVVTRYFGGILLGGGGLVRAYSHSAKIAVDAAERLVMRLCRPMDITVEYSQYDRVNAVLPEYEVKITDTVYTEKVTIQCLVKIDMIEPLIAKITDITNGRTAIVQYDEQYGNFA